MKRWYHPRWPGLVAIAALGWMVAARPAPPRSLQVNLQGNDFRPSTIRARAGDTIHFVNGTGGPHNVAFERDSIAADAAALLDKGMLGDKIGFLWGALLLDEGETYRIVIPKVPRGRYPIICQPHQANMRGAIIVE